MEKYVVDLDKVLDELEFENDEPEEINRFKLMENSFKKSNYSVNHYQQCYDVRSSSSNVFMSIYDNIDLNGTDFAIQCKPPKILNNISASSFGENLSLTNKFLSNDELNGGANISTSEGVQVVDNELDLSTELVLSSSNIDISQVPVPSTSVVNSNNESSVLTSSLIDFDENENGTCLIEDAVENSNKINFVDNILSEVTNELSNENKLVEHDLEEVQQANIIEKQLTDFEKNIDTACDNVTDESSSLSSSKNDLSKSDSDPISVSESITTESTQDDSKKSIPSEEEISNVETPNTEYVQESLIETSNSEQVSVDTKNVCFESISKGEDDQIISEFTSFDKLTNDDINNMSESDLDKYLHDLNEEEIVKENNENVDKNDITTDFNESNVCLNNSVPVQNFPSIEISVIENVDSQIANDTDNTDTIVCQNEAFDSKNQTIETTELPLNELDNINQNNESSVNCGESSQESSESMSSRPHTLSLSEGIQQFSDQMPDNPSSVQSETWQNRGGLVQNIAYFERQEMPNGLTEEEQTLGKVKPFWVPDETAQNCLHCDVKFTLIKRRHHCRSCGKVLCSQCCNFKAKISYLDNKEARVCQLCYVILMRIEEIERINGHPIDISETSHTQDSVNNSMNFPDPNNPAEYCSTVSPFEQAAGSSNDPPLTVMVPVGVLKRPGSRSLRKGCNYDSSQNSERTNETVKQVIFSDGVRPGGDLVESPNSSNMPEDKPISRAQFQLKSPPVEKNLVAIEPSIPKRIKPSRLVIPDSNGVNLPPIVNYTEIRRINSSLPSKPTYSQLIEILRDPHFPSVTFGITKNLFLNTKLISKICCNSVECWSFASKGLASVGQDEILLVLDCDSLKKQLSIEQNESNLQNILEFPRDIFRLFTLIYDSASKATLYTELSHIFFQDGLFSNKENSGFLFVRPTLQCFQNIHAPSPPFLIALLIHKWENPWAQVFPLRLIFRLGYEYKMYPSPIISFPNRKPVYFEIGHTIMNVLADFRNFQYNLTSVKDLLIHVEDRKRVNLLIPKLSYEKVCKVLSISNEHVLAFGGNFSLKADSHFVCVQNEDGDVHSRYHNKLIHFPDSPKKVSGASFIVFSGALKSTTGLKAKIKIVEDGLLIEILPSTMEELRNAIKDMKDFKIECCKVSDATPSDEWIQINWINEELSTNLGVRSQIDSLNLEGIQSARILSSPDYTNERYLIRWVEVFLLQINENSRRSEMLNTNRLAESVSQAFCMALIDYLDQLYESGLTKISLRISLDIDKVGYEAGSGGELLPSQFTRPLDSALIPAIMENISTTGIEDPLVIELLFYILLK